MDDASCLVVDCTTAPRRRGWCSAHYQRWLKHGDPLRGGRMRKQHDPDCSYEGCSAPAKAVGLCKTHYQRARNGRSMDGPSKRPRERKGCAIPDCERVSVARGWCDPHYKKWLYRGDPLAPPPKRKGVSHRKGGPGARQVTAQGYILYYWPEHPNARNDGRVSEHTAVMAEQIGRPLTEGESVHHRNGVRDDNRPENLELWASIPQPYGQRVRDLIEYANTIRERYGVDPTLYP